MITKLWMTAITSENIYLKEFKDFVWTFVLSWILIPHSSINHYVWSISRIFVFKWYDMIFVRVAETLEKRNSEGNLTV